MPFKHEKYQFILEKIIECAELASHILQKDFLMLQQDRIFYKDVGTEVVTQSDLDIHNLTIKFLKDCFPEAIFISEEDDKYTHTDDVFKTTEELIFIIDPLDGTSNYIYGLNQFCFSLGVMSFGEMIGGIIMSPMTDEVFYAMKDCGAFYKKNKKIENIEEIYANVVTKNHKYLIGTTYPCINLIYNKLSKKISVRIIGSVALTIGYALIGKFDGFVSNSAKIWDIAGAIGIASNMKDLNIFIRFDNKTNKYSMGVHREQQQFQILKEILS